MLYLMTLLTHFIDGYMASHIGKGPLIQQEKKPATDTT